MFDVPHSDYDHTQKGLIHWLLLLFAFGGAVWGWRAASDGEPRIVVLGLIGLAALFTVLSGCFARLRVRDAGDALEIRFGPVGVFGRRVRYTDIETVAVGRSSLIDGWGIHGLPGRGTIWNLHGFDCVELRLRGGDRLRIGTDDPQGLAAFLESRRGRAQR